MLFAEGQDPLDHTIGAGAAPAPAFAQVDTAEAAAAPTPAPDDAAIPQPSAPAPNVPAPAAAANPPMRGPTGQAPAPAPGPAPAVADTISAAFRQDNPIQSVMTALSNHGGGEVDPDWDPIAAIKGTKYQDDASAFIGSPNEADTRARMAQIDQENQDRETLASSGWTGTVAGVGAGLFDPSFLIGGGAAAHLVEAGEDIWKSARTFATVGALQSTVSEIALQASQRTRTVSQSLTGIASNTLLMGLLGAAHGFLAPAEAGRASAGIDEVKKDFAPETAAASDLPKDAPAPVAAEGLSDDVKAASAPEAPEVPPPGQAPSTEGPEPGDVSGDLDPLAPDPDSIGTREPAAASAAPTDVRDLTLKSYGLDKVPVVKSFFKNMDPMMRIFSGDSLVAKRVTADMAESGLQFTMNERGIPTALNGVPIDRETQWRVNRGLATINDVLQRNFVEHYYGKGAPKMAMTRAAIDNLRGQTDGRLSYGDFSKQVGVAMVNGDEHPIPQVQRAAQELRSGVVEPLAADLRRVKDRNGDAMLGEAATAPKGDKSFFPRIWNHTVIAARRADFRKIVSDWLEGEQASAAASKERLTDLSARHDEIAAQIGKLDRRLATIQGKQADTATRLDEREMEAGRTFSRETKAAASREEIDSAVQEVQSFIDAMRGEAQSPALREGLANLQKEVQELRAESAPLSKAELDRLEKGDFAAALPDEARKAGRVFLGLQKPPKEPPGILSFMRSEGGIRDTNGDVARALGGSRAYPGLLNWEKGKSLDEWGRSLHDMFPHAWGSEGPTEGDVGALVFDALRGREPSWWREWAEPEADRRVREYSSALEHLYEGRQKPADMRGLVQDLFDERGETPGLLQRLIDKADAGAKLPGAEEALAGRKDALKEIQGLIERGLADRDRQRVNLRVAKAREGEARSAFEANRARGEQLSGRLGQQQAAEDLLAAARQNAEAERVRVRTRMEDEVRAWKGDSSAEAMRALEARDEAERVRGLKQEAGVYQGKGERLTSADSAVDRFVKRTIASDRDLSREELEGRSDEVIDRILGGPDGRLPYDIASEGADRIYGKSRSPDRSSLRSRDFAIPTNLVSDFVEHDPAHAIGSMLRTLTPDMLLTERFGDVDMTDQFRRLNEEFAAKTAGAKSPAESTKLEAQRKALIRDVAAIRDRVRNLYGWSPDARMRSVARWANVFRNLNVATDLGTSVFNRLGDVSNAVSRYGLMNVVHDAYVPFFKGLVGASELPRIYRRQAIGAAIGVDGMLGQMRHTLSEFNSMERPGNKFERASAIGAEKAMLLTGHGPWTDWAKTLSFMAAAPEFLRTAQRIAEGSGTSKDVARMAQASVSPQMAARIWEAYSKDGGEMIEGVHVPNSGDWTDLEARKHFETAMGREANINVVTPGMEEPLWMSMPIANMLGQFKSYMAAATQRLLIANLQQRDARTLQGFFASLGMGMISYRLYTWLSGEQVSDRPQDWIKEAVTRSAMLGWMSDLNELTAKFTSGKADAFRLIGADHPLTRYQDRDALADLLGPTWSKLEGLSGAIGDTSRGSWSAKDTHNLRQWVILQNWFAIRRLLDQAENGFDSAVGVKPRNRSGTQWVH